MRDATFFSGLVSDDACHISRRVFTSQEIYQWEKDFIFARSWLYLCHESQLPNIGDYLATTMCETPVIVARGENNKIHVSVNSCRHRGLPVCRSDRGNAKRFICPYHNWSYTVEGALHTVPQEKQFLAPLDKSCLGLKQVPRIDSYGGLVFGSFNEHIEPLHDYLGDMRFYLDTMFDRYHGGVEVIGSAHKWHIPANWKLPVENQLGDVGHGPYLHGSLLKGTPQVDELEAYGLNVVPKAGHGAALRLLPAEFPIDKRMWGTDGIAHMDKEVNEYLVEKHREVEERLGKVRGRIKGLTFGVYPNFSFLWGNNTIRIAHPRGPGAIDYWSWWVVEKNAPDHIKKKLQQNYTFFFGPGGVLEQEDAEAWSEQYKGSNIDFMDDSRYYYGLGAGEEKSYPELPGLTGSCFNELYAREFYKRWRQDIETGLRESGE
jgi:phenylpropionate dioxygenase-like ring-hydroxylating dioxygenase large terminal subunit